VEAVCRSGSLHARISAGQQDGEGGTVAEFAGGVDLAIVGSDQLCDDGETDTGPGTAGTGGAAPEPFEYVGKFVVADAGAGVGDLEASDSPVGVDRDGNRTAGRREFRGVGEEVGNDLVKACVVAGDDRGGEASSKADFSGIETAA